ncbi:hypothetical protein SHELI_v1c04040 [Spiroplasma helicoides]|uniref:Uncharacterized protein n=1 Tax=Spiroplasma helicoides TaxID=216938 RepID=A0A1B3SKA2_9MOLU|nr:hypothetical protein [Spiroplasma helicoides]AOG60355.1 hypothetical protein SHELI_v1c04040 [Spiroplasma helicoides]
MFKKLLLTSGLMGLLVSSSSFTYSCANESVFKAHPYVISSEVMIIVDNYLSRYKNDYSNSYTKIISNLKKVIDNAATHNDIGSPTNIQTIYYSEEEITNRDGILVTFEKKEKTKFLFELTVNVRDVKAKGTTPKEDEDLKSFSKTYTLAQGQSDEEILLDKKTYTLNQDSDQTVEVKILNRNQFENIMIDDINQLKDIYEGYSFDKNDNSKLLLKFKKNTYGININIDFKLSANNCPKTTEFRVESIYFDKQQIHAKRIDKNNSYYSSYDWGSKTQIEVENSQLYNTNGNKINIQVKLDKDANFYKLYKPVEWNGDVASLYLWFQDDKANKVSEKDTKLSIVISSTDKNVKPKEINYTMDIVNPLDTTGYFAFPKQYANVFEETMFSIKENFTNLKYVFEKNVDDINIIFYNGVQNEKTVDFTNEEYVNYEAWISSNDDLENVYYFKINFDWNFYLGETKITKSISTDSEFLINDAEQIKDLEKDDINIKTMNEDIVDFDYKRITIGNRKAIINVNTKEDQFLIDLNNDIFRASNSKLKIESKGSGANVKCDISYKKPKIIQKSSTIKLSYDKKYLEEFKSIKVDFYLGNDEGTYFTIIFNYQEKNI